MWKSANQLPQDSSERKQYPVYSGVLAYFPLALMALAKHSKQGNDKHNPGQPLHWDRDKSGDELDALTRHLLEGDWTALAWRALANLQKQEEQRLGQKPTKTSGNSGHCCTNCADHHHCNIHSSADRTGLQTD